MLKFCVTGGGTVAPIDDVRRITNFSTGRFASEISEAALGLGHVVRHLRTPTAMAPYDRLARFDLDRDDEAAELRRLIELRRAYLEVRDRLEVRTLAEGTVGDYAQTLWSILAAEPIDVVFHAAALSDYEPARTFGKLKSGEGEIDLRCVPVPKVIRQVKDRAPGVFLVGFKLLSDVPLESLIETAAASGRANRSDLTVANDYRTVREGRHTLHLVFPDGRVETMAPGPDLAERLVRRVAALVASC